MTLKLEMRLSDTKTKHFYMNKPIVLLRDDAIEEWSTLQAKVLARLGLNVTQNKLKQLACTLLKEVLEMYDKLDDIRNGDVGETEGD